MPRIGYIRRYKNILPNPHSRVNLQQIGDDPTTCYINANYITAIDGSPQAYIAAQGPKPDCVVPFWRMIWQEEVSIVIMVTGLIERGKSKCSRYWPDKINRGGQEGIIKYGEVVVKVVSAKQMVGYKMAQFEVKHEGIDGLRKVTHFWFDSWPDCKEPCAGVPPPPPLPTSPPTRPSALFGVSVVMHHPCVRFAVADLAIRCLSLSGGSPRNHAAQIPPALLQLASRTARLPWWTC